MSCSDPLKNIDAKEATYYTLSNLHKYTDNNFFKPNTKSSPFPAEPNGALFKNININLDNIDTTQDNLFIKDNIKDNIYQNCAIQTNNPWYTTSSDYTKCEIVEDIQLDNKLKYNADKTIINLNLKSNDKLKTAYSPYFSNVNKAYCENRWYDWIITPNYYLGNTYYKDTSKFGEADVYKCFKPCPSDSIPYTTAKRENKCIKKKYFGNGIFANKLMFSPIGLINLIGHVAFKNITTSAFQTTENNDLLYQLYKSVLNYNINNKMDNKIYKTNFIYNTILLSHINVYTNINAIYDEFKKCIEDNILNDFDNSENQDYKYSNLLTYKHRNFNEDESELYTLKGLDVCGALIPPILHHTWILANIFKPFQESDITDDNANKVDNTLYKLLYNEFKDENKALRLKNIFYKAVNICYDNKSNFSINIIDKTKKIINTYKGNYDGLLQIYIASRPSITNSIINTTIENMYITENIIMDNKYLLDHDLYTVSIATVVPVISEVNKKKYIDDINKYIKYGRYFYAIEELETPSCEKGYVYDNKVKTCQKIVEEPIIDKNAPVEDEIDAFNIPEITKILSMFLQIIIVIVLLYIIYIFYDIFGETIFTVYNYVRMKFAEITYNTYAYLTTLGEEDAVYEKRKTDADYELANMQYKNLEQNKSKILTYMKEHNIPIKQDI
jgi:hypothetical protein